ncbi:hypothetical protein PMIN01_02723 [Paraphaeosphaeria minitans]|uniref:Uncharacterized protein n=1 Tax=Paraphaeosphaeria minitans TaxID=565426 RepID=A0A9P6GR97_9PLEO|nr:hypothetical protein PMIN01_02723 [Paraphaeosphaeria minitans]
MATERNPPDNLECFRAKGPRGHSRSAKILAKAGIWIGYAASNKHNLSFQGLPSFKELKDNCENMTQPIPPMVDGGVSNDTRVAIYRACGETSPEIHLLEIQVMKRPATKVTIMPLHHNGQSCELFCILVPQRHDRTLQGLQVFRPYELEKDGNTFNSNYELASARNGGWVRTEDEVVEPLGIPLKESAGTTPTSLRSVSHSSPEQPIPVKHINNTKLRSGRKRAVYNYKTAPATAICRNAKLSTPFMPICHVIDAMPLGLPYARTLRHRISREMSHTATAHRETSSNDDNTVLPALTEQQAKRLLLVWVVVVDNTEYDFSHSILECPKFSDFLELVLTEAAGDPQVTEKIDSSIMWRLTYQVPGQLKKAFALRIDANEDQGYERLRHSVAQSSFWNNTLRGNIDIKLRLLA